MKNRPMEIVLKLRDLVSQSLTTISGRLGRVSGQSSQTSASLSKVGAAGTAGLQNASQAADDLAQSLDAASQRSNGLLGRLGSIGKGFLDKAAHIQAAFQMVTGAVSKAVGLFRSAMSEAFDAEKAQSDFSVLLKSADAAREHIASLQKFAASTPLGFADLAQASKLLLSFGSHVSEVQPALRMIGDIAMGDAQKFQSLALVFAQVKSAGRLMGQDLLQMINQGFNPLAIMSQQTGISMGELKKLMEEGAISFAHVEAAMKLATSEGGLFAGAMQSASQTGTGMISTLKDNWAASLRTFGNAFADIAKSKIGALSDALKRLVEDGSIQKWAEGAFSAVSKIASGFIALSQRVRDVGVVIGKLFDTLRDTQVGRVVESFVRLTAGGVKMVGGVTGKMLSNIANGKGVLDGTMDVVERARYETGLSLNRRGALAGTRREAEVLWMQEKLHQLDAKEKKRPTPTASSSEQPKQQAQTGGTKASTTAFDDLDAARSRRSREAEEKARAKAEKEAKAKADRDAKEAERARLAAEREADKVAKQKARERVDFERQLIRQEQDNNRAEEGRARELQRDAAQRAQQALGWFRDPRSFRQAMQDEREAKRTEDRFQRDFERLKKQVPNWETATKLTRNQEIVRRLALARRDEKLAQKRLDDIARNTKDLAKKLEDIMRMK